jgi:Fe-S-cluster-containing dehydrogenase component
VQPLRGAGLPADLPDRRDLQAQEQRHRRYRFHPLHRLPPLRGGLSLRRAAVRRGGKGIVKKCNMCVDEIDAGRKPYCVMACMMRVLDIGPIDQSFQPRVDSEFGAGRAGH